MTQRPLKDDALKKAVAAYLAANENARNAAAALGINESTFRHRLKEARRKGLLDKAPEHCDADAVKSIELTDRIRTLETALRAAERDSLDAEYVRTKIIKLGASKPVPPRWMVEPKKIRHSQSVPTLFLSDLHWGEIVDAPQIGGVNSYDLQTAHKRIRLCVEKTITLLTQNMQPVDYPGIVLALGGDMISGDIHDELMATNEKEVMPTVVDLWGVLVWVINTLADKFGNVFVPCVTGNHGRITHKIRAKGRNFTSLDWLLYQFLNKHFENDKRVAFLIPDGPDAYYRIYSHRYLLTHGDQFRGGDGMIGALGPIIRGDHKKRSRNAQIEMEYDTMLLGHWHQLIQLRRLIVNGSLKGYDEYANQNNFGFEPPQQALWLTHPTHGITLSAPIYCEEANKNSESAWISWKDRVI